MILINRKEVTLYYTRGEIVIKAQNKTECGQGDDTTVDMSEDKAQKTLCAENSCDQQKSDQQKSDQLESDQLESDQLESDQLESDQHKPCQQSHIEEDVSSMPTGENLTPYTCKSTDFVVRNAQNEEIKHSVQTHVPLTNGHEIDVIEMQVAKGATQVLAVYNHVTKDCCFIGKHLYRIRSSGIFRKPWYGALSVLVFVLNYIAISTFTLLHPLYFSVGIAFIFFLVLWGGSVLYAPYIDHKLRVAVEADIIARYGVPVNTIYYYM